MKYVASIAVMCYLSRCLTWLTGAMSDCQRSGRAWDHVPSKFLMTSRTRIRGVHAAVQGCWVAAAFESDKGSLERRHISQVGGGATQKKESLCLLLVGRLQSTAAGAGQTSPMHETVSQEPDISRSGAHTPGPISPCMRPGYRVRSTGLVGQASTSHFVS